MSTNVQVSLSAVRNADGTVSCTLECDGQQARLVFDGTDVFIDVAGGQAST